jgi:hypothetical protein
MCDILSQRTVEEVIREKVDRGEMFTAFEVSLEAQKRGVAERHRHLKHVVHQCFESGQMGGFYTRTLTLIPGAPQAAFLFHRTADDPAAFRPLDRSPANPLGLGTGRRVKSAAGYGVDRRARVCVPVQLLRRAGMRPGDEAVVLVNRNRQRLALSKTRPASGRVQTLASYRVDRYGNVRIAQRILQRARLGGSRYDMNGDATRVVIQLHGTRGKN